MKKTDNKKDNKKIKSVLKLILNWFCYITTAISLLLAVLMAIVSCNGSNSNSSVKRNYRSTYDLQNTSLKSSFGNFSFIPYRLPDISNAGEYHIDTYDNDYRHLDISNSDGYIFDVFVVNYSSIYSVLFRVDTYNIGYLTVFYNGQYYSAKSGRFTTDNFTINDGNNTNVRSINVNSSYIVCFVTYDTFNEFGADIYFPISQGDIFDYCSYYCSFNRSEFNSRFNASVDEDNFSSLYSPFLTNFSLITSTMYENYILDNRKFIFKPTYITTQYWTAYYPLRVEEYYYNDVDDVLPYSATFNSISYGRFYGGQTYASCIGFRYGYQLIDGNGSYYDGDSYDDLLRLEELWNNSNNLQYFSKESYPSQVDKTGAYWILKSSYYVYSFRGYFPKGLNQIDYNDFFIPFENGILTSNMSFKVSGYSLDASYTRITGSTGNIKYAFNTKTVMYLNNSVWSGIRADLTMFTFANTHDMDVPTENNGGTTVLKNTPQQYNHIWTSQVVSIDVNEFYYLMYSSFTFESSSPIWEDTPTSNIIDAITGVFNVFGMAFQGIVPLLNISLGAGLTLGVLVFTPLVVTIIFAIVKLFKR